MFIIWSAEVEHATMLIRKLVGKWCDRGKRTCLEIRTSQNRIIK